MNSIYALLHPVTREIRYVGKTNNVQQRYRSHCYTKSKTHVSRWVQVLRKKCLFPALVVLENGLSDSEWQESEQFWIGYFRFLGADLTNITKGGNDVVSRSTVSRGFMALEHYIDGETLYQFINLTPEQKEWVKINEERCRLLRKYPNMKWKSNGSILGYN